MRDCLPLWLFVSVVIGKSMHEQSLVLTISFYNITPRIPAAVASYRSRKFFACTVFVGAFLFILGVNIWWAIAPPQYEYEYLAKRCSHKSSREKVYSDRLGRWSTCGEVWNEEEIKRLQMRMILTVCLFALVALMAIIFMCFTLGSIRSNILRLRGERPETWDVRCAIICCCLPCLAAQMMRWTNGFHKIPGYDYFGYDGVVDADEEGGIKCIHDDDDALDTELSPLGQSA